MANHFLEGNSKRHDIGTLHASVDRYSFRDPIAFDVTLNGGKGGIIEGNGRLEMLCQLCEDGFDVPKGIKAKDGEWYVPCIFGVDAESEQEAIAYSVSHNLSSLWGADDFSFLDSAKLFDDELLKSQLTDLADISIDLLPVGISRDDFDLLLGLDDLADAKTDKLPEQGDAEETNIDKQWGVIIFCDDESEQVELIDSFLSEGKRCKALM